MGIADQPSLPAVFQATAARCPDRVALRTVDDGERLTYGEYAAEVARVARGLAALGVRRGDTVAMLLSNRPSFHVVDSAALHLGAACVSIYPTLPPDDIAGALRDAGATLLVTETAMLEQAVAAGVAQTVVLVDGDIAGTIPLSTLDGDLDVDAAWRQVGPDDVAVIIFTSGTTGRPKGVELTHRAVLWNIGFDPDTYNFRLAMNRAGYPTFDIDRLGTGGSSAPPSALVTHQRQAAALHDAVSALRAGSLGAPRFTKLIVIVEQHTRLPARGDCMATPARRAGQSRGLDACPPPW